MLLTLFAFVVALGLLIAVHEWGHYRMAVARGVRVLRFSDLGADGVVAAGLQAVDEELWLIRPDAHTAACVRTPEALADAVHTLLGH